MSGWTYRVLSERLVSFRCRGDVQPDGEKIVAARPRVGRRQSCLTNCGPHRRQLCAGLLDRRAGFQSADDTHRSRCARRECRWAPTGDERRCRERNRDIGFGDQCKSRKTGGGHTNHCEGNAFDLYRSSDDRHIPAVMPLPESVPEHRHRFSARWIDCHVAGSEKPPHHGSHTQFLVDVARCRPQKASHDQFRCRSRSRRYCPTYR